jgi:hypothetical protein
MSTKAIDDCYDLESHATPWKGDEMVVCSAQLDCGFVLKDM